MAAIKESEAWLESCRQKFTQNYQPHMPVPIKSKDILEQRRLLEQKIHPIINSPKPKADPPKEEPKPKEEAAKNKKNPAPTAADATNANTDQSNNTDETMEVE